MINNKSILIWSLSLAGISMPALIAAQPLPYIDGRPQATKRMECKDFGIVLRYGNGPDSCDVFGAREANVNKENGIYYLFYDGAGKDGWRSCLAESEDLIHWTKKGAVLKLGKPGSNDAKSASSPWILKDGKTWHMFYLGTPNTSPPPDRIPSFPYLTMKAKSANIEGPWIKQYNITPFSTKKNSFYSVTASPGYIIKYEDKYLQFFSGASQDSTGTKRTLGIASTKNLDGLWTINMKPIFPITEQVENSSVYYDEKSKTWYLFTNHIGIDSSKVEYTDAVWVYWSKDIYNWDITNKAIVLDSSNCTWSKGAIGMPSIIKAGDKLALLYDAFEGYSTYHMKRNIGLAWIDLPIKISNK
jgi:predicted GH43/DUF377 family glycosyl hydrolase